MLTVIVALGIPLGLNFQRRVVSEIRGASLAQAQVIASAIGDPDRAEDDLPRLLDEAERVVRGRVIVVDGTGVLVGDSAGTGLLGDIYATPERPELVTALRRAAPASEVRHSEELGRDIVVTAVPIVERGEVLGAVRVTLALDQARANLPRTFAALGVVGLAALLAGLVIAFAMAESFARPLRRLARTAARLGRGDLSARSGEVHAAREIQEVAGSFDEMAERLQRTVRGQRRFAGNASHQLRTPLTALKLRLESALAEAPQDLRPELEAADREVDRLAEIVERLLVLARHVERTGPWEAPLHEMARAAVERWRERFDRAGRPIGAAGDRVSAGANPADVEQILDNLIDNALVHGGGPVTIETAAVREGVVVAVADRGRGIPSEEAGRVLERFYRGGEAPEGGSGLGLAIVRDLAERWDGSVRVAPAPGGGTRVEVHLPAAGP